jgi:CheY-like chemotaxis protein
MTTPTILVIDDSATIRKMVDSHLSQEGYRVLLAPTGGLGLQMAREFVPDLILLDHQLPGTTGIEVCRQIIDFAECSHIPFVVSSTLRKQAYVEYLDVSNVVDSLPKPFKPELLKMTVANALETGAMIVSSQKNGTAIPEVVGETEQPALSGDFRWLGLREVIDFLNNGRKDGMLEVETARNRVCFFLKDGRIQGIVSPSFDTAAAVHNEQRHLHSGRRAGRIDGQKGP